MCSDKRHNQRFKAIKAKKSTCMYIQLLHVNWLEGTERTTDPESIILLKFCSLLFTAQVLQQKFYTHFFAEMLLFRTCYS